MGESRFDKGFTKVPNILLNNLIKRHFTGVEMKLILVIWRYSYGFMKESAELSNSFLAKEIGSDASVVSRLITRLVDRNVVKISYINSETKVRALSVNNNIGDWGIDKKSTPDQAVNRGDDQQVKGGIDHTVKKVLTVRSSYIENNKDIYLKIKKRVFLTDETEQIFIKWLEYKNDRGDIYSKVSMKAVADTLMEKVKLWGVDAVRQVVMDCIASGYKNIVWEKLMMQRPYERAAREFVEDYDHSKLEMLSRRDRNEQ